MNRSLKAKDIMTSEPIMVPMSRTIGELVGLFHHYHISGAPVQDAAGDLVGVVSLRDVAFTGMRPLDQKLGERFSGYRVHGETKRGGKPVPFQWDLDPNMTIADIMTPVVFTVEAESPVSEVAETMRRGKIHRLVVTEEDRVVGIVTSYDLLKAFCQTDCSDLPPTRGCLERLGDHSLAI